MKKNTNFSKIYFRAIENNGGGDVYEYIVSYEYGEWEPASAEYFCRVKNDRKNQYKETTTPCYVIDTDKYIEFLSENSEEYWDYGDDEILEEIDKIKSHKEPDGGILQSSFSIGLDADILRGCYFSTDTIKKYSCAPYGREQVFAIIDKKSQMLVDFSANLLEAFDYIDVNRHLEDGGIYVIECWSYLKSMINDEQEEAIENIRYGRYDSTDVQTLNDIKDCYKYEICEYVNM